MTNTFLMNFIEILNDSIQDMDGEPIEVEDNYITSIDWLGGDPENYEIPNSKEDTISLCKTIMKRTLDYPIHSMKMDFYRYTLEEYIIEFAKQLQAEWKYFNNISLEAIPIRITEHDAKDAKGNYNATTKGNFDGFSGTISIYNASYEHEERDKETARHEVIHYMLLKAGINFYDDSGLFWFFATIYKAHPYKEMDEQNQEWFDLLMQVYKDGAGKNELEQVFITVQKKAN